MERDLGVVGARLHAQVTVGARRVELIAGKGGEGAERSGSGQREAFKQRRAEAERDREA